MALFTAHSATYGSDPTPSVIQAIEGIDYQTNANISNDVTIGSPYPQFVVMRGQQPTVPMSTRGVQALLTITGSTGADIDDTNLFRGWFAQMKNGLIDPSGTHRSLTADRGVLVPRTLTVNHQEAANVSFDAVLYSSDGTTHPILQGTGTLPAITRHKVEHTLSSNITIAGIDMGCVTSVEIDFGNSVTSRGCNSDIFDSHLEQPGIQPTITITGLDLEKFDATGIPPEGKGGTHTDTVIYLRKYDESGIGFVDDATVEHIKIDAEGMAVVQNQSGQGPNTAELTVQFTCSLDDAGNAPIGITASSAIP